MNTTLVQLADGGLLKIEGSDATHIAASLTNNIGNQPTRNVPAAAEAPMEMPVMNFGIPQLLQTESGEETPLVMPVLNFAKQEQPKQPAAATDNGADGEAAMEMPLMSFA